MQLLRKRKNRVLVIGILISIIGIKILFTKPIESIDNSEFEQDAIDQFYEQFDITKNNTEVSNKEPVKKDINKSNNTIDYLAVLKIPSINLEKGLVNIDSYLNDVKYNIEILDDTDMPFADGDIYLAAHAGNSSRSYFKNISKLDLNDEVILYHNNQVFNYKVINKYEIIKTGQAAIKHNSNKKILVLISCVHNTDKQIVVICELV